MSGSIGPYMLEAEISIKNALKAEDLAPKLGKLGYTPTELLRGKQMLDTLRTLVSEQDSATAKAQQATADQHDAHVYAKKLYTDHLVYARRRFSKDAGVAVELGLKGRQPQNLPDWIERARKFYINALASQRIRDRLAPAITADDLRVGQAAIEALATSEADQQHTMGLQLAATARQDAAHEAFKSWYNDYPQLTSYTFRDEPDNLKRLGL